MTEISSLQLYKHFADIPDQRKTRGKLHHLSDIIVISLLAMISGADDFVQIALYGQRKEVWLKTFLELPNGIPSHDTFRQVFATLKSSLWQSRFIAWIRELEITPPEFNQHGQVIDAIDVLAIDGKTARRSRHLDAHGLHTVSIWAASQGIVIAQLQVPEKSNEITAIPEIIESACVAGGIITIDAMGCQKSIAWAAREHLADYILGLKNNQPELFEMTTFMFDHADSLEWKGIEHDYFEQVEQSHGRQETRRCWVMTDLSLLEQAKDWRDLRSVVRVEATRKTRKGESCEVRYFLSSLGANASLMARAIRKHWGIENSLHYVLDMTFHEDWNRTRVGYAQANLVTLRHVVLNLFSLEKRYKMSMKAKRKCAGWDDAYVLEVLGFKPESFLR